MRHSRHLQLCMLGLIADGHAERCPGTSCAFWEDGCILSRVEDELADRPALASLLLDLRRKLEAGQQLETAEARAALRGGLAPAAD